MTDKLRAALYARVSKEEQVQGYSLDAQKRAFRSLVESREWTIFHEYVEEGRSAHTDDIRKRPVFMEAIEDAVAGRYDVLVVHKIDRFSRKLKVTIDYLEKLGKAGVGFVSIENQIDYTTPAGKFMLVMQGGLAELYSDNLSLEVKKGKQERKAQGLYNGLLPFGVMKGENRVPVPDPSSFPGLIMMFELAASGKSDREVARALNAAGYRTAGNRVGKPFTKDGVRGILINRFFVGELPDGKGGWIEGSHQPFINAEQFQEVQDMRARNRKQPKTMKRTARTYSLSGVLRCVDCGGPMWVHSNNKGRARIYCRERAKGEGCVNRGTFLDVYEEQVKEYLTRFVIPSDYQAQILKLYGHLQHVETNHESKQKELAGRLERIRKLYEWGDKPEAEYLYESGQIKQELAELVPEQQRPDVLAVLGEFLSDVSVAWEKATQEQRNRLARRLFEFARVKDENVVSVRPQPELRPFFQISEDCQSKSLSGDPDRGRTGDLSLDRTIAA